MAILVIPMYIVKVNDNYYIKRMPNTGREHAVGCNSWEMPDEFSGRTDLFGTGISYDGEKHGAPAFFCARKARITYCARADSEFLR